MTVNCDINMDFNGTIQLLMGYLRDDLTPKTRELSATELLGQGSTF